MEGMPARRLYLLSSLLIAGATAMVVMPFVALHKLTTSGGSGFHRAPGGTADDGSTRKRMKAPLRESLAPIPGGR
jgi:hypothetical protein